MNNLPTSKDCFLYTFDGIKEAIYSPCHHEPYDNIHEKGQGMTIRISRAVALRKFEQEKKPTFYACYACCAC